MLARLMKLLLVLVVLLMGTEAADAMERGIGGAVWQKTIHVYDYTSAAWDGVIAQTVADANAILPKRAPQVVYHRMAEATCDVVPKHRRGITVCSGGEMWWKQVPAFAESGNFAEFYPHKHVTSRSTVYLTEGGWNRAKVACHELIGHAILGILDDYDSKTPGESCVHASAEKPGTWDAAVARWLYKKFAHHSGPRRRGRGKH